MSKLPQCPLCNGKNVAVILWGYPLETADLTKALHENKIILGGCCISDNDPKWECNDCHYRWGAREDDDTDSFDYDQGFNLDEVYY